MNTNHFFLSKLLAGSIVVLTIGPATQTFAQSETLLASSIVRLKGHARCSTDGGKTWRMVKTGDTLESGAMIQTAMKSDMDLVLGEPAESVTANRLTLAEDTLLRLDKVARKRSAGSQESTEEISLDLSKGTITGDVRKLAAASRYEIAFVNGVAGAREGIYTLRENGELTVSKGKAFVALTDGRAASEITAGQHFSPATGTVTASALQPTQPTASPAAWQPTPGIAPETPAISDQPPRQPAPAKRKVQPPSTGLRRAAP